MKAIFIQLTTVMMDQDMVNQGGGFSSGGGGYGGYNKGENYSGCDYDGDGNL